MATRCASQHYVVKNELYKEKKSFRITKQANSPLLAEIPNHREGRCYFYRSLNVYKFPIGSNMFMKHVPGRAHAEISPIQLY